MNTRKDRNAAAQSFEEIAAGVRQLMPRVIRDLQNLIRHPSVAFPGYPREPVMEAAETTLSILKDYGLPQARLIEIPGGYPAVYGEIPAPPGAPVIMMYAHYDVQPARKEDGWKTDPWEPVEKNGRLFGRGAADDKSGIMMIAASIAVFGGKPPVGIKVLIEGEEETASHIEDLVTREPDLFSCDAFIIADNGNLEPGAPALTTSLRGEVSCILEVTTLDHAVHSGMFGGAAPDALIALIKILATLHDADGNVAIKGLRSIPSGNSDYPEKVYRESAGVLDGVDLIGTGSLGDRLWFRPSVNVIGINAPTIQESANILIPRASAKISLRIAPDANPGHELQTLIGHLRAAAPWNVRVEARQGGGSPGFSCSCGGLLFAAAEKALRQSFGRPAAKKGTGGSVPLVQVLHDAVPHAEFILWGAEDAAESCVHGPNESVDLSDLERITVAQSYFLSLVGK